MNEVFAPVTATLFLICSYERANVPIHEDESIAT